ncbi:hypothetical protein [Spiroplasma endosymbiont of Labia minor]|uniref:hypothetical protein n=1 Tax=Spiroplasma endosymbiont of Labia minor TaxID=3066305 RepID=UPI0030D29A82
MEFNEDFYLEKIKDDLREFKGIDTQDPNQVKKILNDVRKLKKALHLRGKSVDDAKDIIMDMLSMNQLEASMIDDSIAVVDSIDETIDEDRLNIIHFFDENGNEVKTDINNKPKLYTENFDKIQFDGYGEPIIPDNINNYLYSKDDLIVKLDNNLRPMLWDENNNQVIFDKYWNPKKINPDTKDINALLNIDFTIDEKYINYKKEKEKINNQDFYNAMRKNLKNFEDSEEENYGFVFFQKIADWIQEEQQLYFKNKDKLDE